MKFLGKKTRVITLLALLGLMILGFSACNRHTCAAYSDVNGQEKETNVRKIQRKEHKAIKKGRKNSNNLFPKGM
jgi:hypothetical protein